MHLLKSTGIVILALNLAGCVSTTQRGPVSTAPMPPEGKATLSVALFPWIPDSADDEFASLRQRLEDEFERQNPEVDLVLRLQKWDPSYYNPPKLAGWLAGEQYDLVEIDAVILGDLISAEVIEPWSTQEADRFFPAAVQASTTIDDEGNTTWWGVPHLLCGYFIVSTSPEIDGAPSISALAEVVKSMRKPLVGNFDSSWDLPSLYLDARVDLGLDPADTKDAVRPPVDDATSAALSSFASLCDAGATNPCVDGTYSDDWDAPVREFVEGRAAGFWGYSERLHLTVRELRESHSPTDNLLVTTIPLGMRKVPLLFADIFVRRAGCSEDRTCSELSTAFTEFMNSEWAMVEVLLSRDATAVGVESVPRYLLPATKSAFEIDGIQADRLFGELEPFAESGFALPNSSGMYERRRTLEWLLMGDLSD